MNGIIVDVALANAVAIILAGAANYLGLATTDQRRFWCAAATALLTAVGFALANEIALSARNIGVLFFLAMQLLSTALGAMSRMLERVPVPEPPAELKKVFDKDEP